MRKLIFVSTLLLAAGAVGCGGKTGPVVVTPEQEAEQRRDEKLVHDAEAANFKQQQLQKPPKTQEQEVEEAERRRQGGR